ncbi:hypothetical protein BZA77DRAFT_352912 [Pyronema omphalodes]|nr:hypothetical protein BZA77DRAFT_352912 [Pyronema omphalodes]
MNPIFFSRSIFSCFHAAPRIVAPTVLRSFVRAASHSAFQNSSVVPDSITFGLLLGRQYQIIPGATVTSHISTSSKTHHDIPDDIVEEIHQKRCEVIALMKVIANLQSGGPNDAATQDAVDRVQSRIEEVGKRLWYLLLVMGEHYRNARE